MTPQPAPGADLTKSGSPVGALSDLPSSFPPWATKLAELYFSGTTSAFVLHGNTYDFVRSPAGGDLSRRSQEAKADEFVGLERRPAFQTDRILDAAAIFDMRVIGLARAVADPDHMARGRVPVARR